MLNNLINKYGALKTTTALSITSIIVSESIAAPFWIMLGLPNLGSLLIVAFLCPAIIAPIVIISLCNLTDRLQKSEEKYKTLFETANDAIFILDKKGNVLDVNSTAHERLGYSKEEMLSMHISQLDSTEFAEKVPERIKQIQEHGKAVFEAAHIRKDGSIMPVEVNAKEITLRDKKVLFSVIRDISERKKLEEGMRKVQRLEATGVLAGGIAHDFNNILTAILGNINLALFDSDLKDRTKHLLSEAEKASLRAKELTQQLLTFAQGGEPVKKTSSLKNVIKDSANFVLHGDKVVCGFHIPDDLWLVDIDKGQISQVIQNIVINASHAMPEGGTINLACSNVTSEDAPDVLTQQNSKFVKISIQDSGIGIPEKVVQRIFDPYFSTKHDGSGLGLAITHSIMIKHKGHISVESTPEIGTTFTLYLPTSEQAESISQIPEEGFKASKQAKILIMDDEEVVRNITKKMLVKLGHEVKISQNGEEAIKLYQEAINTNNKFDIVIMDLTIPGGMGGKEAVQEILDIDKNAKVIVASGYSNDPVMANFKDYGFSAALIKPFKLEDVAEESSKVLAC